MDSVLLVEMEVGVDVGVLVMMGGHVEHLQPSQGVVAQSSHSFGMLSFSC